MIFSGAGLELDFNKATFGVERLAVSGDPEKVSWVQGKSFGLPFGNNFLLNGSYDGETLIGEFLYFSDILCTVTVSRREEGVSFRYQFKNTSKETIKLAEGDLGIYLPFNDKFDAPEISLRRRVHAHVRTHGCAYVYCERYSGDLPSLAWIMTEGESFSYSLERGIGKGVRGEIVLELPAMTLEPEKSYTCESLLFACHGRDDFFKKSSALGFLTVNADKLTLFEGEEICLHSQNATKLTVDQQTFAFVDGECRFAARGEGEHHARVSSERGECDLCYYVLPKDLLEQRKNFVLNHQFLSSGENSGAFTAFDHNSGEKVIRSGVRSHLNLAGFRAAPLLFLLAEGSKGRLEEKERAFVDSSIAFYDREVYRGGEVSDDVGGKRTRFFKRYYNYPLYAAIKYEEYRLTGDITCLIQSAVILSNLYKSGSVYEVAPTVAVAESLRAAGKKSLAEDLTDHVKNAADKLIKSGNKYARFKGLPYGPEIVYGSLSTLLDAYLLTGDEYYLLTAKEHLIRLESFAFPSSDYATDEIPLVFQEDRATGLIYDMSPHFTVVHFAAVYHKYFQATGEQKYRDLARKILLSAMTLFKTKGMSFRSKAAAKSVNETPLSPYEEISCGEDVVLYHFGLLFDVK